MNMAGGKLKTGLPWHTFCSWLLGQQVLFLLLPPWLFFLLALFCSVCNAAWSSPCQAVRYLKMLVYLIFYSPKWLFHTFSVQKGPTPSLSSFSIEDVFLSLHWENETIRRGASVDFHCSSYALSVSSSLSPWSCLQQVPGLRRYLHFNKCVEYTEDIKFKKNLFSPQWLWLIISLIGICYSDKERDNIFFSFGSGEKKREIVK